jgi:signal peptidase II
MAGLSSRRLVMFSSVIALVIALDQWTKFLAREHFRLPRLYADGIVELLYVENTGAFLSMGANLPPLVRTAVFGVAVLALLIAFIVAVVRGSVQATGETIAAAAIIGGGIGNLIDRLGRGGRVTDFIYMQLGPLHTGIFNVADMAITFGVIWMLIASLASGKK